MDLGSFIQPTQGLILIVMPSVISVCLNESEIWPFFLLTCAETWIGQFLQSGDFLPFLT